MLAFLKKLLLPSFPIRPSPERTSLHLLSCPLHTNNLFYARWRWSLAVPLLSNCASAHIGFKGICSADVIDNVDVAVLRAALLRCNEVRHRKVLPLLEPAEVSQGSTG